ncbi:MAG: hypothetical protein NDI84_08190 [Steroidobacteraceae bacterium]|nr:hypothetical protein [Steroidobacteraceae bacterium]
MTELLDRWTTSVELHARYLALDDAAYARVQDWPKHQRPTRWVVELARTRLLELKRLLAEPGSREGAGLAEALELMAFLTNLLGSEHVERFIPLAQPRPKSRRPQTATVEAVEPTVETRAPRAAAAQKQARRRAAPAPRPAPAATASTEAPAVSDKAVATVIADAVRLISWGREWPQLAGLIARLADRPPEAEVWKVLRHHRAAIEAQARHPRG